MRNRGFTPLEIKNQAYALSKVIMDRKKSSVEVKGDVLPSEDGSSLTGFTLLEMIIVAAVFTILFGTLLAGMSTSRQSWQSASDQIDRQVDARQAVNQIAWELRSTNPSWLVNDAYYNISINSFGDRIDFYAPIFNANNEISSLQAVRYYVGGANNAQLLRRVGATDRVVANNIDNDSVQKPFFSFNNTDNTIIDIKIPVIKNNIIFTLQSQVNLRNREEELENEVIIEGIEEG